MTFALCSLKFDFFTLFVVIPLHSSLPLPVVNCEYLFGKHRLHFIFILCFYFFILNKYKKPKIFLSYMESLQGFLLHLLK